MTKKILKTLRSVGPSGLPRAALDKFCLFWWAKISDFAVTATVKRGFGQVQNYIQTWGIILTKFSTKKSGRLSGRMTGCHTSKSLALRCTLLGPSQIVPCSWWTYFLHTEKSWEAKIWLYYSDPWKHLCQKLAPSGDIFIILSKSWEWLSQPFPNVLARTIPFWNRQSM